MLAAHAQQALGAMHLPRGLDVVPWALPMGMVLVWLNNQAMGPDEFETHALIVTAHTCSL